MENMTTATSAVLFVGGQGVGKMTLVEAIIGIEGCRIHPKQITLGSFVIDEYEWGIDTKYYQAPIKLWKKRCTADPGHAAPGSGPKNDISSPSSSSSSSSAVGILQDDLAQNEENCALDGVVVLVDLTREDSFDEVKQWGEMVVNTYGDSLGLRICVASKLDQLNVPEEEEEDENEQDEEQESMERLKGGGKKVTAATVAAAVLRKEDPAAMKRRALYLNWCLDHGFEYIEADCTSPHIGGETREKEGIPRVIEALQSNMWTSMFYKTDARPGGGGGMGGGVGGGMMKAPPLSALSLLTDVGRNGNSIDDDDEEEEEGEDEEKIEAGMPAYCDLGLQGGQYSQLPEDYLHAAEGIEQQREGHVPDIAGDDDGGGDGSNDLAYVRTAQEEEEEDTGIVVGQIRSLPYTEEGEGQGAGGLAVSSSSTGAIQVEGKPEDNNTFDPFQSLHNNAKSGGASRTSTSDSGGGKALLDITAKLLVEGSSAIQGDGESSKGGDLQQQQQQQRDNNAPKDGSDPRVTVETEKVDDANIREGSGGGNNDSGSVGASRSVDVADVEIESLMAEIQSVRDNNRAGVWSDGERRERATETALKLLALLGGDDTGSDDDEED